MHWIEELDWKAYSITWRLHVIDHLKQARRVLAALLVTTRRWISPPPKPSSGACSTEVPFTRAYGFRLHAIAPGQCTLDVPFQPLFERPGGIVGGQVFMAAAGRGDVAGDHDPTRDRATGR